jgi:hypothetical protein
MILKRAALILGLLLPSTVAFGQATPQAPNALTGVSSITGPTQIILCQQTGGCDLSGTKPLQLGTASQLSTFINSNLPAINLAAGGAGGVTGLLPSANLATTGVSAGSYTNLNATINAEGQVTAASNGSGGSLPSLTNGQVLGNATGSTTTATATNIVAGSGVTITATGGNITIGASGSGGVSGPGSSVNTDLASWNGTGGNALSDSLIPLANVVQTSRTISTSAPLTGGGNLASNLTLGITIPNSSLLGGNGSAFTNIGLGTCMAISGGALNNTCGGTVTSVGLTMPTIFAVAGTPVTGSSAFTVTLTSQSANTAFLSPNGSSGVPAFRSIVYADLPTAGSSGSCTTCNVTFNAQGIATAFSNGTASTPVIFTGTTAGTANAQTIASPTPSGFTLTDQRKVSFMVGAGLANTTQPTLAVNSTTAEPMDVQAESGITAMPGGYLQPAVQYDAVYQAACTCYVVTTTPGSPVATVTTGTVGQGEWTFGGVEIVTTASQTRTLPASATIGTGGGLTVLPIGVSVAFAPQGSDTINGVNATFTCAANSNAAVTMPSAGAFQVGGCSGSISGLTPNTIPKATSSTAIGNSSITDNGTVVNTTEPIEFGGAKIPTFFRPTISWVAGQNPNNAIIVADLPAAITLFSAAARVEIPVGATATISLFSAPSGTACASGTNLASATSINANGTAATNQLLTITTASVAAGSSLCLQTTGGGNWTSGSGVGALTIGYNPT